MKRVKVKNQLKEYRVEYTFNGSGVCYIKAQNRDEASNMFYDDDYSNNDNDGNEYEIYSIEETNN